MKQMSKQILGLIALSLLFFACSQNSTNQKDTKEEIATMTSEEEPISSDSCNSVEPPRLCTDSVQKYLAAFEQMVETNPTMPYPAGYKLNTGDIAALLNDTTVDNSDTIYAMIGYKSLGEESGFDLIFCVETPANSGKFSYYDFSSPCPKFCPTGVITSSNPIDQPLLRDLKGQKGYWFGRALMDSALMGGVSGDVNSYVMLAKGKWDEGVYWRNCPADELCEVNFPSPVAGEPSGDANWIDFFATCDPSSDCVATEGAERPCCYTIE